MPPQSYVNTIINVICSFLQVRGLPLRFNIYTSIYIYIYTCSDKGDRKASDAVIKRYRGRGREGEGKERERDMYERKKERGTNKIHKNL